MAIAALMDGAPASIASVPRAASLDERNAAARELVVFLASSSDDKSFDVILEDARSAVDEWADRVASRKRLGVELQEELQWLSTQLKTWPEDEIREMHSMEVMDFPDGTFDQLHLNQTLTRESALAKVGHQENVQVLLYGTTDPEGLKFIRDNWDAIHSGIRASLIRVLVESDRSLG